MKYTFVRYLRANVMCLSVVVACSVAIHGAYAQRTRVAINDGPASNVDALDALLARPVSVNLTQASLLDALAAVSASAKVRIQYQTAEVRAYARPITLQMTNAPLGEILGHMLAGTTYKSYPMDRHIWSYRKEPAHHESSSHKGQSLARSWMRRRSSHCRE